MDFPIYPKSCSTSSNSSQDFPDHEICAQTTSLLRRTYQGLEPAAKLWGKWSEAGDGDLGVPRCPKCGSFLGLIFRYTITIWLWLTVRQWKITMFNRQNIYFYGPWLPWLCEITRGYYHYIPLIHYIIYHYYCWCVMRYRRLDFYLSLTKIDDWNLWLIMRIVSAHHSRDTCWPSCMMRCDGHNFHGSIYPSERQELLFNGGWQAPACQSLPEWWIVTRRIICNIPSRHIQTTESPNFKNFPKTLMSG